MTIKRKTEKQIKRKIVQLAEKMEAGAIYGEAFIDEELTGEEEDTGEAIVGFTSRGHRIGRRIARLYYVLETLEMNRSMV